MNYYLIFDLQKTTLMNRLNFSEIYPNEESFKLNFKEMRDQEGVVCSHCGGKEHNWKRDKWIYECKKCNFSTTLRSETVMHSLKLPFRYWFFAIHLLTSTKKSFSAKVFQRQLSHTRCQPIFGMLYKLRQAMLKLDEQYLLSGKMELDEGFFSTNIPVQEKYKSLERGRGNHKKTNVLGIAESNEIEGETKKNGIPRKVRFIKMQVITDLKADTITSIVKKDVSVDSELTTDDSTSYVKIKEAVAKHDTQAIPKEKIGKILPWIHIAISNAKLILLNIHHDIKLEHLQNYLNEFCYNFNRRYFGEALFERKLVASISYKNKFRYN